LYLHLLVDSDVHLPVFRSLDLHRPITIATSGLRWNHRRSKRVIAWLRQLTSGLPVIKGDTPATTPNAVVW